ncbi:MAG: hypothetical protein WB762_21795 [Candidatus Sulfotelmatobacter sp.]
MTSLRTCTTFVGAIVYAAISMCDTVAAQVPSDSPRDKAAEPARIAFCRALPQLHGGHLNITVVAVTYAPGESSPPHRHPGAVVGDVSPFTRVRSAR